MCVVIKKNSFLFGIRTTEYEACDRLSRDIQAQIVQRNAEPVQSEKYARISANTRLRLNQFTNELQQLSIRIKDVPLWVYFQITKQCKNLYYFLMEHLFRTIAEEERRRRQIETLQSKLIQLQTQFSNVNGAASISRTQLFHKQGGSLWNDNDDDDDDTLIQNSRPFATSGREQSVAELRQQQSRMLDDQEEGLDNLSKIISRQKQLAIRIGDEVEVQNGK